MLWPRFSARATWFRFRPTAVSSATTRSSAFRSSLSSGVMPRRWDRTSAATYVAGGTHRAAARSFRSNRSLGSSRTYSRMSRLGLGFSSSSQISPTADARSTTSRSCRTAADSVFCSRSARTRRSDFISGVTRAEMKGGAAITGECKTIAAARLSCIAVDFDRKCNMQLSSRWVSRRGVGPSCPTVST